MRGIVKADTVTVHAGYDSIGASCLGHVQPGTRAISEAILAKWGGSSDGIYNCRNVRGGSTKSAHAEGRAYDHHWTNEKSGFEIANALVALNATLGIQVVIFWDRIWSFPHANEGFRPYHGADPHHSHLHVEQNWSGATELTLPEANRVLNPSQQPAPAPTPPQEDEDMPSRWSDKTEADKSQVLDTGSAIIVVDHIESAQSLDEHNVKTIGLHPDDYAKLKKKAEGA